jgi:hypothetical protein
MMRCSVEAEAAFFRQVGAQLVIGFTLTAYLSSRGGHPAGDFARCVICPPSSSAAGPGAGDHADPGPEWLPAWLKRRMAMPCRPGCPTPPSFSTAWRPSAWRPLTLRP